MPSKRLKAEQIIPKLREAEVELAKGRTVVQVVKRLGVTEQTYYRWRKEYGGLLRLRAGSHVRWPVFSDADTDRRVQPGMPGDRRVPEADQRGCLGEAERPVCATRRAG